MMGSKSIKHCLVCGKAYEFCKTCNASKVGGWKSVTCCAEHFAYHIPIIGYYNKIMPKSVASEQLKNAIKDYGEVDFCDNIKCVVAELLDDNGNNGNKGEVSKVTTNLTNNLNNTATTNITNTNNTNNKKSKKALKTKKSDGNNITTADTKTAIEPSLMVQISDDKVKVVE